MAAIAKLPSKSFSSSTPTATDTNTPTPTHSSLSPSTLAALAPSSFLHVHLTSSDPPIRPNGRSTSALRPIALNLGSLTYANGSSLIRLGDTAVVCGVRAEILEVRNIANYRVNSASTTTSTSSPAAEAGNNGEEDDSEIWTHSLLVPNIELNTGSSPSHLPDSPPSSLAQSLSHRLLTLLRCSHLVPTSPLKIYAQAADPLDESSRPVLKAYWTLYIDHVVLSSAGGSLFSASWLALLAALSDTVLPAARWDEDLESVVCDPEIENVVKLGRTLRGMPVPLGFVGFEPPKSGKEVKGKMSWVLIDPDEFEEAVCGGGGGNGEEGIVVIDKKTFGEGKKEDWKILRIEKSGDCVVGSREIRSIVQKAGERWEEWVKVLKNAEQER